MHPNQIREMKKTILFSVLILSMITCCFSQKPQKHTTISDEEREISVLFADGLKNYYSENYKGAEELFRRVLYKNRSHAPSYYMLGKLKAEKRNYIEAEENLQNAIKYDKNNIWYYVELAKVFDERGCPDQSYKLWKKIHSMDPKNEEFLGSYFDACIGNYRYKEALALIDKIEQLYGVNDELASLKIELYLETNDVKGALKECDRMIEFEPTNSQFYLKAASICTACNMNSKAVQYLELAKKAVPSNGLLQLFLGENYASQGDSQSAFEAYRIGFLDSEVPVESKVMVLQTYMAELPKKGVTNEQKELATILTEVNPEAMEGWACLASIALYQQEYETASEYFEKALAIDEAPYELWQDYLYSLIKSKQYTKIIAQEENITELYPTQSLIFYTLGVAYANVDENEKAVKYLEKALRFTFDKKETSLIYETLSEVYQQMGDTAKSGEYKRKAQSLGVN